MNIFFKATSPVSCLTPPPETASIHIIDTPETASLNVQDASNQTESLDAEEEMPALEAFVKQEQNPCQMQSSTTTTNYEIVTSAPEKICNVVRITTTTSVNAGFVSKVDKAENTIINMADCTKYSLSRNVTTSVDQTIEHVISCHSGSRGEEMKERAIEENAADVGRPVVRPGPRIIEITEENCDSFHENLEFFSRRKNGAVDGGRKSLFVEQHLDEEDKEEDMGGESDDEVSLDFVVV